MAREGHGVSTSWSYHKPEDKVALVNMVSSDIHKVFGKKNPSSKFFKARRLLWDKKEGLCIDRQLSCVDCCGCLVPKRAGISRDLDWPFMRNNSIG